jgi:hypothetical protein
VGRQRPESTYNPAYLALAAFTKHIRRPQMPKNCPAACGSWSRSSNLAAFPMTQAGRPDAPLTKLYWCFKPAVRSVAGILCSICFVAERRVCAICSGPFWS